MPQNSTLFIKDLIFSGLHGETGRERFDRQRLAIDIAIQLDTTLADSSDNLADTYDYKRAIEISRGVVEKEQHTLIEKIANQIAEKICFHPRVQSAEVTLRKIDASSNGLPGIIVKRKRSPQEIQSILHDFDLNLALTTLEKVGGVSMPILSESYRRLLLEEAETYQYHKQPEIVGPAKVREQLSSVKEFRPDSLFWQLKNDFQELFNSKLAKLATYPFQTPLNFNEMSLQLYEKDSIGITPHMDGLSILNVICVFILAGKARVAICDDRQGSDPKDLDTTPGNVILLRGPGFLNSDFRPFHFVSDVKERRIVFGLRQKKV
jgi:dihydroneopterin aldolase